MKTGISINLGDLMSRGAVTPGASVTGKLPGLGISFEEMLAIVSEFENQIGDVEKNLSGTLDKSAQLQLFEVLSNGVADLSVNNRGGKIQVQEGMLEIDPQGSSETGSKSLSELLLVAQNALNSELSAREVHGDRSATVDIDANVQRASEVTLTGSPATPDEVLSNDILTSKHWSEISAVLDTSSNPVSSVVDELEPYLATLREKFDILVDFAREAEVTRVANKRPDTVLGVPESDTQLDLQMISAPQSFFEGSEINLTGVKPEHSVEELKIGSKRDVNIAEVVLISEIKTEQNGDVTEASVVLDLPQSSTRKIIFNPDKISVMAGDELKPKLISLEINSDGALLSVDELIPEPKNVKENIIKGTEITDVPSDFSSRYGEVFNSSEFALAVVSINVDPELSEMSRPIQVEFNFTNGEHISDNLRSLVNLRYPSQTIAENMGQQTLSRVVDPEMLKQGLSETPQNGDLDTDTSLNLIKTERVFSLRNLEYLDPDLGQTDVTQFKEMVEDLAKVLKPIEQTIRTRENMKKLASETKTEFISLNSAVYKFYEPIRITRPTKMHTLQNTTSAIAFKLELEGAIPIPNVLSEVLKVDKALQHNFDKIIPRTAQFETSYFVNEATLPDISAHRAPPTASNYYSNEHMPFEGTQSNAQNFKLSFYDQRYVQKLTGLAIEQAFSSKEFLEVNLEPESFGKLRLLAKLDGSSLEVRFITENNSSAAILKAAETGLNQIIQEAGLKLAGYGVNVGSGEGNNSNDNQSSRLSGGVVEHEQGDQEEDVYSETRVTEDANYVSVMA